MMKKIALVILLAGMQTHAYAQSVPTKAQVNAEILNTINANGRNGITGPILQADLVQMLAVSASWQGAWGSSVYYSYGEIVSYSGSLWFANTPTLGTPPGSVAGQWTQFSVAAGVITPGTTLIVGGTPGDIEYNNNGVLGEKSTTGSGSVVLSTSPSLTTPDLGTPSAANLANATNLPIATGVSGLGANVADSLAIDIGSAGSVVTNGGALGTPSSGDAGNLTGLPISTGVSGLGIGVAAALANPLNGSGGVLGTSLTSADLFIGNSSGIAAGIPMSGDATISNTGALTLASSGVTAGTYGDGTHSTQVTFDAKGRATSASSVAINIPASAVSGLGTAATQNTGTSGATVPFLNGANTWSGTQTFSGGLSGALTGSASQLESGTWEVPGAIGSTTPNGGAFSALTDTALNAQGATCNSAGGLFTTSTTGCPGTVQSVPTGGTGMTSLAANTIPVGNGTSPLQASGCHANSSNFFCDSGIAINLVQNPLTIQSGAGANVTAGQLVKWSAGNFVPMSTTDTDGAVGIAFNTVASGGSFLNIATSGITSCIFDGATTAGDWVTISSTVSGDCHDTGSATRATGQYQIGQVLSTNASAGSYTINIDMQFTPAGGSGVSSVSNSDGTLTFSSTSGAVVGSLNLAHANVWTGTQTFAGVNGGIDTQSGTTYTLGASAPDCGELVRFTNSSAVTVTIPATLPAGCNIAIEQAGAGKISVNGSAVSAATLQSAHSYTGTFAQWSIIGISIESNSGGSSAVAVLTGDGS